MGDCAEAGTDVVVLESPTPDMKASIRAGLAHIRKHCRPESSDVWLVAPADIPNLSTEVINKVLAAFDRQSPRPIVPVHKGRRGHPALFPWAYVDRVDALSASQGINALLTGTDVVEIECRLHIDKDSLEFISKPFDDHAVCIHALTHGIG